MQFSRAVNLACKFAAAPDRWMVFSPGAEVAPGVFDPLPALEAAAESCGVVVPLALSDSRRNLPKTALHGKQLKDALSGMGAEATIAMVSPGVVGVSSAESSWVLVSTAPPGNQQPPTVDLAFLRDLKFTPVHDQVMDAVLSVLKFPADEGDLAGVHFGPCFVEASDQAAIARSPIPPGVFPECVVPPEVLTAWPGRPRLGVSLAVHRGILWLQVDDHLRWARLSPASGYPDLSVWLEEKVTHEVLLDSDSLAGVVSRVHKAARPKLMALVLGEGRWQVSGLAEDGQDAGWQGGPCAPAAHAPIRMVFQADKLRAAMGRLPAQSAVELRYSEGVQPLGLHAAGAATLLWPMIPEQVNDEAAKGSGRGSNPDGGPRGHGEK